MNKIYKNISYGLSFLICLSLFSACDFLEEEDTYLLSPDNYFSSEQELDAAIYPIYNYIFKDDSRLNGISGRGWGLNSGADDITATRGLNKQRLLEFDDFEVSTENNDLEMAWKALYRAVGAANNVIRNIDRIQEIPMADGLRNARIGEVRFLRALSYFYLVRFWGEVPIVDDLMNGVDAQKARKAKIEEVYDFILADALEAEKLLPVDQVDKGRPSQDAVKTLLSYVYLHMAGWPLEKGSEYYQKAADKAKEIIDAGNYQLEADYSDLWKFDSRFSENEHIFAFYPDFSSNRNYGTFGNKSFRGKEEGGWREVLVEKEFARNFPNDNRKEWTIYETIKYDKKGRDLPEAKWIPWENSLEAHPFIAKFRDIGGATWNEATSNCLYPIFRFADVLLIYAEASNLAEGAPSALAYAALWAVQDRAYVGSSVESNKLTFGASQDEFDEVVLQERAWEFAFEMKRWHDLVRRNKVKEANLNHADERNDFDASSITEDKYLFPIPAREKLINPNL
ncbi:RagB/SusD family nutrient uptake outer membrane protein [Ancylomarina sp. YFZ004]